MEDITTTAPAGDPASTLDLGAWIGRGQAFSFVANHCSAAQAECLARIRKGGMYKSLDLTWEQFCEQYTGASRVHADQIIRRLEEFGAAYFRLSEIIRISPNSYRGIQGSVKGEALEYDGESIPITPENAAKIRRAVAALRTELRKAHDERTQSRPDIIDLRTRLDACFDDMTTMTGRPLCRSDFAALQGLIGYSFDRLKRLQKNLPKD
jgi:hypothetical protein